MSSLEAAVLRHQAFNVVVYLNHPALRTLTGRVIGTSVGPDHFEIENGERTYIIPYSAIVAMHRTE